MESSLPKLDQLKRSTPAVVSVTLEMFHRLVLTCSDEERMELVKHGLLDVVMVAVSQSSFLSDYESGIVVIGGLLDSIHRTNLKKWIVGMDFSSLLTTWGGCRQVEWEMGSEEEREWMDQESEGQNRSGVAGIESPEEKHRVQCE